MPPLGWVGLLGYVAERLREAKRVAGGAGHVPKHAMNSRIHCASGPVVVDGRGARVLASYRLAAPSWEDHPNAR